MRNINKMITIGLAGVSLLAGCSTIEPNQVKYLNGASLRPYSNQVEGLNGISIE